MLCISKRRDYGRAFAWFRTGSREAPVDCGARADTPISFWPDAGRSLLWRFAPAVEPRPRSDWLADFCGCSLIYPDLLAVGRAALAALETAAVRSRTGAEGGARAVAMCIAPNATVARLLAYWRWRECREGLLIPNGGESAAVAPLPLKALYLPEPAAEKLSRVGLRQLGDVARLERGALDMFLGRRFAHIAYSQSRGMDVSPPVIADKPQAVVERVPVANPGVSSMRELLPYLEVLCWRIAYLLFTEREPRAIRRLDLTLRYMDGGRRGAGATLTEPTPYACDFFEAAMELAARAHTRRVNVAAAELAASRFYPLAAQDKMFVPHSRVKTERIETSVNRVRAKYGFDAIKTGGQYAGAKV